MDYAAALTADTNTYRADELIAIIRALGMPVRELARELRVHRSTIYRWAKGLRRPSRRGWRTALLNIARSEQVRAQRAERERRAAETPLTWRVTRQGERVVYGPATRLAAGETVTVDGETVTIARTGKRFEVDGLDMVYGYTTRPVRIGPRLCRCGCGEPLTVFDYEASDLPGYKFDCV